MAKLIVHWSGGAQREIPLDQRRMVIGRRKGVEILLNDSTASSQHAVIVKIGSRCYLQDLESTNGTLVNGTPVQKHTLKDGDEIQIGRTRISYVAEPDLEATMVDDARAAARAEEIPANLAGIVTAEPPPEPTLSIKLAAPAAAPAAVTPAPPPAATPAKPAASAEPPSPAVARSEYAPWASEDDNRDMVDSMIDAIRSHREWVKTERINRKLSVDEEWKLLVEAAKKLKLRLGNHPQLKFFEISRQHQEIMIRVQRPGRSAQHAILLARQHPNVESPLETIWLIETGEPDRHFSSCERIMRSVLSSLAPLIA